MSNQMPVWLRELWVLGFWWSTWTLADIYLIPYTPTSELLVFGVCMSTLLMVVARNGVPAWRRKLEAELSNVTQSHVGNQYGTHVDDPV